eukprot:527787-Rhodomonas_salina.1
MIASTTPDTPLTHRTPAPAGRALGSLGLAGPLRRLAARGLHPPLRRLSSLREPLDDIPLAATCWGLSVAVEETVLLIVFSLRWGLEGRGADHLSLCLGLLQLLAEVWVVLLPPHDPHHTRALVTCRLVCDFALKPLLACGGWGEWGLSLIHI